MTFLRLLLLRIEYLNAVFILFICKLRCRDDTLYTEYRLFQSL